MKTPFPNNKNIINISKPSVRGWRSRGDKPNVLNNLTSSERKVYSANKPEMGDPIGDWQGVSWGGYHWWKTRGTMGGLIWVAPSMILFVILTTKGKIIFVKNKSSIHCKFCIKVNFIHLVNILPNSITNFFRISWREKTKLYFIVCII